MAKAKNQSSRQYDKQNELLKSGDRAIKHAQKVQRLDAQERGVTGMVMRAYSADATRQDARIANRDTRKRLSGSKK